MPLHDSAVDTSHNGRRPAVGRTFISILLAAVAALLLQLLPLAGRVPVAAAETPPPPKAVFIVGPTNGLTDDNLADAEKMAEQAEAAGMDVHRVFFPHATWENVLANIQGASLVVYMGHGYGWPSPYTSSITETRQDGMGLNAYDGSAKNEYKYYGATRIRDNVRLAPNAVVFLNHLCYASGNGEPGMSIPDQSLAAERVDNFASGWLAVGARAVFAYGWTQKLNYPQALMSTDASMDELFSTVPGGAAAGTPKGFIGWRDVTLPSQRTPGAMMHLDPHKSYGYYRSVTGDLGMTAADFRSGAGSTPPPPPGGAGDPPEITSLSASSDGDAGGQGISAKGAVAFHPNGDGIEDELIVTHDLSKAAFLDATVTNDAGKVVDRYTLWKPGGTSTSRWNGRNSSGGYVTDGLYTLTYVPRDEYGQTGDAVSVDALVLTAIKLAKPSVKAFFPNDSDSLAKTVTFKVTLNQTARVSWQIVDAGGDVVRTVRSDTSLGAGTISFRWDGRSDGGAWLPEGAYRSVVTATTSLGTYSQEREVYLGAFRVTASASPKRGAKVTFTILSTEPLTGKATVRLTQPGLAAQTYTTTKVTSKKFKLTVKLASGGDAGTLELLISGTDKYGGKQQSTLTLPLS